MDRPLTGDNEQLFTNDDIGNPKSGGILICTWEDDGEQSFINANGKRISRSNGTQACVHGASIIQMTVGDNILCFSSHTITYNDTPIAM